MDFAQLAEPVSLANGDPWRDFLEVAIMGNEDAVAFLRYTRHNRIRSVWRQNIPKAGNFVASGLKELTDRFRHTVICEEPQFRVAGQAAALWLERTNWTSIFVRDGYSARICSSV